MKRWIWTREEAAERFPDPITPLGWSTLQDPLRINLSSASEHLGLRPFAPNEVARVFNGYVYIRKPYFGAPSLFTIRPLKAIELARHVLSSYVRVAVPFLLNRPARGLERIPLFGCAIAWGVTAFWRWRSSNPSDPAPDSSLCLFLLSLTERSVLKPAARTMEQWRRIEIHLIPRMRAECVKLCATRLTFPSDWQPTVDRIESFTRPHLEPDFLIFFIKKILFHFLKFSLRGFEENLFDQLTSDISTTSTSKMVAAFHHLGSGTPTQVAAFMNLYGHVTESWDIAIPTLAERALKSQSHFPHAIATMAGSTPPSTDPSNGDHPGQRAGQAHDLLARKLRSKVSDGLANRYLRLLSLLREFIRLDEELRFTSTLMFPAIRALYAQAGRHLRNQRILNAADDIYFLTIEEIKELMNDSPHETCEAREPLELRARILARRSEYELAWKAKPPPNLKPDGSPLSASGTQEYPKYVDHNRALTRGTTVSGTGIHRGKLRFVQTLSEATLVQPDEIAALTTPHPMLVTALRNSAGILCETGAWLSHGALLARELGRPMIIITGIDGRQWPARTWLEINCAEGSVRRLDSRLHSRRNDVKDRISAPP